MADFNGLSIDKDVQENTGEFTVLPAGKYKACIIGDELTDNSNGTGKVWKIKLQILEGQYTGEILKDAINITNPNQTCQQIGQGTLKRICNICNVPYPPQNTNGMFGKPLLIDIKVEKFLSNTSGKELNSNKIKSYNTANQLNQSQPQPQQSTNDGW